MTVVARIREIASRVKEAWDVLRLGGTHEQRARYLAARGRQDALCEQMEREGIHDETPEWLAANRETREAARALKRWA
jgi:hypothetical protein